MPSLISKRFGLKLEDAQAWYKGVNIAAARQIQPDEIKKARNALVDAGVLTKVQGERDVSSFCVNK